MNIKTMDNNQLFKAVVESQNALKNELLIEIKKLDTKIDNVDIKLDKHREETKKGFEEVNRRCDLLGKQLNALDEDAPTGEDFGNLVTRVDKLEKYQNFATA